MKGDEPEIEITYPTHEELKNFYPVSTEKRCTICHKIKPISEFYRNKRYLDGYGEECKPCLREYKIDWRKRFAESAKARERAYYSKNKKRIQLWRKRRDLQKQKLPSTFTEEEWIYLLEYYENRCAYCNEEVDKLEMEHMTPLVQGGHHVKENIVPSCKRCNLRKGRKTVEEIGYELWKPHPFSLTFAKSDSSTLVL